LNEIAAMQHHGLWPRRSRAPGQAAPLSLALQGGGSFGAFTWGVLDRLLEDGTSAIDAISGTSAGAVNAVALASGLAEGGADGARATLDRVWRRIGQSPLFAPFGGRAVASLAVDLSTRVVSPYQFNPLGLNPLRDILAEEIDFERLRDASPVRLLVAATRVSDGRVRLFREDELTLEAVLASTCLPLYHHAVAIGEEWYWDGGYTANPPLTELVAASDAAEILLVQLTPTRRDGRPTLSPEIVKRLQEIAFNNPLEKEIEALERLTTQAAGKGVLASRLDRKLRRLRLHRIAAEDWLDWLGAASALDVDWALLTKLREGGRAAASSWLAERG
jgi:NTE family protein